MYSKLKKISQKCFALILAFALTTFSPLPVNASDASFDSQAEYDLLKGGTQEFTLQNDDGSIAYVTITRISENSRVSNGTYNVSYKVPLVWEANFHVNITSNQITSAHSPHYTLFSGQIKSTRLTRESATQASYYLAYSIATYTTKTGVRATINNNTLNVSKI